ncbi:MAG: PDZ domain-containing protein, partial [Akkermansiaceae bacterium]|nr:PDZ domain-containing protein [Akkermansiaceae bacterium]
GVLIDDVEEGLAAAEAGLRRGDIVTSIDGKPLRDVNQLRVRVGQKPPGTRLELGIVRDGGEKSVQVIVGDRAQRIGGEGDDLFEGITVAVLDDGKRKRFGIPARIDGLVVTETDPSSPYNRYLDAGTVILEINDRRVRGISDARSTLRRGVNKLYVYTGGRTGYLALRVP